MAAVKHRNMQTLRYSQSSPMFCIHEVMAILSYAHFSPISLILYKSSGGSKDDIRSQTAVGTIVFST